MEKWFGKGVSKLRTMTLERAFGPTCVIFIGKYINGFFLPTLNGDSKRVLRYLRGMRVNRKKVPCYSIKPESSIGKEFVKKAEAKTGQKGLPMVIACKDVEVLDAWVNPSISEMGTMQELIGRYMKPA
jgi:hypothetical protein